MENLPEGWKIFQKDGKSSKRKENLPEELKFMQNLDFSFKVRKMQRFLAEHR